jgi:hypothetical protein
VIREGISNRTDIYQQMREHTSGAELGHSLDVRGCLEGQESRKASKTGTERVRGKAAGDVAREETEARPSWIL